MNPTENREWTHVLRKGKQFLLHYWHRRVTLVNNAGIRHERGRWNCDYDKRNISVVMWLRQTEHISGHLWQWLVTWCDRKTLRRRDFNLPLGTLCSVASLLAATLHQKTTNCGISYQLRRIYIIHTQVFWNAATCI